MSHRRSILPSVPGGYDCLLSASSSPDENRFGHRPWRYLFYSTVYFHLHQRIWICFMRLRPATVQTLCGLKWSRCSLQCLAYWQSPGWRWSGGPELSTLNLGASPRLYTYWATVTLTCARLGGQCSTLSALIRPWKVWSFSYLLSSSWCVDMQTCINTIKWWYASSSSTFFASLGSPCRHALTSQNVVFFSRNSAQLLILVINPNSVEFGLTIAAIPVVLVLLTTCGVAVKREIKWCASHQLPQPDLNSSAMQANDHILNFNGCSSHLLVSTVPCTPQIMPSGDGHL